MDVALNFLSPGRFSPYYGNANDVILHQERLTFYVLSALIKYILDCIVCTVL